MHKIKIKNFQSVELEEIVIDGFTTITGRSNVGKTAILRAITSSIFNKPVGQFLRDPKSPIEVSLKGPNYEYTWKKNDKGINQYIIGDKLFDKCGGNDLSDLVSDAFKPMKIGDKEVYPWYASQFDQLFLINESNSKISEFFAEFCRIGVINKAIKLATQKKKESDMIVANAEVEIKQIKSSLDKYGEYPRFKSIVKELEDQKSSIDVFESQIAERSILDQKINECRKLIGSIGVISRVKISSADEILKLRKICADLTDLSERLEKSVYKYHSLGAIEEIDPPHAPDIKHILLLNKAYVLQTKALVSEIPALPSAPSDTKIQKLIKLQKELDDRYDKVVAISKGVKSINLNPPENYLRVYNAHKLNEQIINMEKEVKTLDKELSKTTSALNRIKICPTCNKPVGTDHKD